MNHFKGKEFYGRAGTNSFECVEMIVSAFKLIFKFFEKVEILAKI
jgi:hypothetical protein